MSNRKPRLLVVDDDPSTLATYSRILALEGYDVSTATDGAIGLSIIRREPFDLVLTDHRMPTLTGLELLAEGAALPESPPIVMYTALGSPALEAAARRLGAAGYSDGLWDVDGLLGAVKRYTSQTRPSAAPLDPRLRRALTFIRRGFRSRQLSLDRTAKVARVSTWHLDKLLHRETGTRFKQHVRLARIAAAKTLLRVPGLPLKQIAANVGYANDGELRRDFRKMVGFSPKLYRRAESDRK